MSCSRHLPKPWGSPCGASSETHTPVVSNGPRHRLHRAPLNPRLFLAEPVSSPVFPRRPFCPKPSYCSNTSLCSCSRIALSITCSDTSASVRDLRASVRRTTEKQLGQLLGRQNIRLIEQPCAHVAVQFFVKAFLDPEIGAFRHPDFCHVSSTRRSGTLAFLDY